MRVTTAGWVEQGKGGKMILRRRSIWGRMPPGNLEPRRMIGGMLRLESHRGKQQGEGCGEGGGGEGGVGGGS